MLYPKDKFYQLLSVFNTYTVSPLLRWLKVGIEQAVSTEAEYRV